MTIPFSVPSWVVRRMNDNERLLAEIVRHAYVITDPAPGMPTMPCAIIKWPWGKANKVLADNVYRIAVYAAACGRNGLKIASDGDRSFLRFLEPWLDPLKGLKDVDMTSALAEQEQVAAVSREATLHAVGGVIGLTDYLSERGEDAAWRNQRGWDPSPIDPGEKEPCDVDAPRRGVRLSRSYISCSRNVHSGKNGDSCPSARSCKTSPQSGR
jgi:hypothetical protein